MQAIKAVIFDIDGTLLPEVSWLALTRDLGGSVEGHIAIHQNYKNGKITYEQSKEELIALWQATGNARKPFFQSVFRQWALIEGVEDMVARVQEHFLVCLITGSMDTYAEAVARKLSVSEWHANTTLYWDDAETLVDMDYTLDQSNMKVEQFLNFCAVHQLEPEQCITVGDSDNDIGLFKKSGHGIAVGYEVPEALAEHAWKTIGSIQQFEAAIAEYCA
jgi:HAD superfamily phosphoserine phosphatase-like hydrolase